MYTSVAGILGALMLMASTFAGAGPTVAETAYIPSHLPQNYESLKACEKQALIWNQIESTKHSILPDYSEFGLGEIIKLAKQSLGVKGKNFSDFSPVGWTKYLHSRAAVAKVRVVPTTLNKYSGIFSGAECGLLRLSLTYKPTDKRAVAPGLALKVLRDSTHSANVSALVAITGQGEDYNFFKFPMSNIVPTGSGLGPKLVHSIFKKISNVPEEILVHDMATINSQGATVKNTVAPRQIFFVPGPGLDVSSNKHDVREDFLKIPAGTIIYRIYAVNDGKKDFNYAANYELKDIPEFVKDSQHIADIVMTSDFLASEFGDNGLFFRHQFKY